MTTLSASLNLADGLVKEGRRWFTFEDARTRLGRSSAATGNLLKSMRDLGLVERVCRGRYLLRPIGALGTPAWAEDSALAVAAAFAGVPHRIAYRSALDEHSLLPHCDPTFYVACAQPFHARELSGWPLVVVKESPETLGIGAKDCGGAMVSDWERAILESASRTDLVGGVEDLAEAITWAGSKLDARKMHRYAETLGLAAAFRRVASIADALGVAGLAGTFPPPDGGCRQIDLDPAEPRCDWLDRRWKVRWPLPLDEVKAVTEH